MRPAEQNRQGPHSCRRRPRPPASPPRKIENPHCLPGSWLIDELTRFADSGGLEYGSNSSAPKVHRISGYSREADGTPVICAAAEMKVTKNYASKGARRRMADPAVGGRSEEHTSELQS